MNFNKTCLFYKEKLKEKYSAMGVGCHILKDSCFIFFDKNNNSYGDLYLKEKNGKIEAHIDFCQTDTRFTFDIENEFDKVCSVLYDQFSRWDYYYDTIMNNKKLIANKFSEAKQKIDAELKDEKIKEEYSSGKISCISNLVNKINKNHVFYRIEFTPMGFIAAVIYDNPPDEQVDYDLDKEFDLFLNDIKRNLGIEEKIKQ